MAVFLPSHTRVAMTMADAVEGFIRNILSLDSEEMVMWQNTVIRAERFDWQAHSSAVGVPDNMSEKMHKLWLDCWQRMPLMDIHGFPTWEKGVHDCLQARRGARATPPATHRARQRMPRVHTRRCSRRAPRRVGSRTLGRWCASSRTTRRASRG